MFFLYITLAYTIPNIYVFFRIRHLFISKAYRRLYLLIYLLLVALYPLVGRQSTGEMSSIMQALTTFSGYVLPFFLYLFLSVLLFDIFLLLNLKARILSSETRKRFSFRVITLTVMVFLSVGVVAGGAINLNTIQVSKYEIEVPHRNSRLDHIRVAFVADIHIQQSTSIRFIEQFVRKVNALQPDILLLGGDIVEGHREDGSTKEIESSIRNLKTKYGSFAVLGNHESYGNKEQSSFFRKSGITLLCDSVIKIDSSFYLAGRYEQRYRQRKPTSELLSNITHDLPVLMLDHRPTELQEASQTAVDVQFSGHTHNGQLFPLNYIIHSMYELSWGYLKIKDTNFFVTSGLRLWGPPVKTAGKSEIMLVDINFK